MPAHRIYKIQRMNAISEPAKVVTLATDDDVVAHARESRAHDAFTRLLDAYAEMNTDGISRRPHAAIISAVTRVASSKP